MSEKITGGCTCGAIRFECDANIIASFNCHCRECQKFTGSGYIAGMLVDADTFVLTSGEPRYYTTHGDSGGQIRRGFCSQCGSPICAKYESRPNVIGIAAGTLDDPSIHRPTMDIYTGMAQAWDHMDPDTAKFEAAPIK